LANIILCVKQGVNMKTTLGPFMTGFASIGNLYPKLDIPSNLRDIRITDDNYNGNPWSDVGMAFNEVGLCIREAIGIAAYTTTGIATLFITVSIIGVSVFSLLKGNEITTIISLLLAFSTILPSIIKGFVGK
jgi:hypothetical protein